MTNKILLILSSIGILSFLIPVVTAAQASKDSIKISAEYGAFSTQITNQPMTARSKFGQTITVRAHIPVNKELQITAGLGYLESGERVSITNDPIYIRVEEAYTSRFLNIPIGVYLPSEDFYFHPEIFFLYNFSNRERIEFTEFIAGENPEQDRVEDFLTTGPTMLDEGTFNQLSIGFALSAGVRIPILEKYEVNIGVRYFLGLSQLVSDTSRDYRHSGIGLTTAFIF